jgi:putative peptidoglycan lipid II flippase
MGALRSLGVASVVIAAIAGGSRVLGFVRDMLISREFGANGDTDAFYLLFALVYMPVQGLSVQVPRVLVPAWHQRVRDHGEGVADAAAGGAGLVMLAVSLMLAALGLVFDRELIEALAPEFDPETKGTAVRVLHAFLPSLPMGAAAGVIGAVSQARGHIFLSQATTLVINVFTIAALGLWSSRYGIVAGAWGLTAGTAVNLLLLLAYPLRHHIRLRPRPGDLRWGVTAILTLAATILLNDSGGYTGALIERHLATRLPAGHLSCLDYANRLLTIPNQLILGSLMWVLLPALSELVAARESHRVEQMVLRAMRVLLFVSVPAMTGAAALAAPLVNFAYARGAFGPEDARLTEILVVAQVPWLVSAIVRSTLIVVAYGNQEYRVAGLLGVARIVLVLLLYPVAISHWGALGVGVALAVVDPACSVILSIWAERVHGIRVRTILPFCLRLVPATAASVAVAWWAHRGAQGLLGDGLGGLLPLTVAAACGAAGLFLAAAALGLDEGKEILGFVRGKLGRGPA